MFYWNLHTIPKKSRLLPSLLPNVLEELPWLGRMGIDPHELLGIGHRVIPLLPLDIENGERLQNSRLLGIELIRLEQGRLGFGAAAKVLEG